MLKIYETIIIALLLCSTGYAQERKLRRPPIDSSRIIEVKYNMINWNKDPQALDSGAVIVRDANSKKLLIIQIDETEPDSGIFSGNYSVNWGVNESLAPEVYVLPQKQEITNKELAEIKTQIESGEIKRKPIVVRKSETGTQVLEVFDSREQAESAIKILRDINKSRTMPANALANSKTTKALYDASEIKSLSDDQERIAKQAEKLQLERLRQEEAERQRLEKLKKEQELLEASEKLMRKKQAIDYAESALDLYRVGKYSEAEQMFRQSFDLDPSNNQYYLQYGIALNRNQKFNEAVVALNNAKGKGVNETERLYFLALTHYKLKEFDFALKNFDLVIKSKDSKLMPISYFYKGLVRIDQKKYEEAKVELQIVLDKSKDPQLDNKAEKKIDEIDRLLAFLKNQGSKFIFNATLGAQYDSNVLQLSNSQIDEGQASDVASTRVLTGLGLMWRPVYNKKRELGLKLKTDYVYTLNGDLDDYDPFVMSLVVPYSIKGRTFKKPSKFEVKPGYEYMFLGQNADGTPKDYLSGITLDFINSISLRQNWYFTPSLKTRYESFFVNEDQNTIRWTLNLNSINFIDSDNKKGFISDLGYGMSHADGESFKTSRLDFSTLYTTPIKFWDFNFAAGVYYYYLAYTEAGSVNNNLNAVINFSKPINDWLDLTFISNYMINNSNSESSDYKKFTSGLIFNIEKQF